MDVTTVGDGAVAAVLVSEFIELLKTSPRFKWLNEQTDRANRVLGAVAAFLTGLGIHVQFEHGTLIISGLAAAALGHALVQWAQQQLYYRLVVKQQKG